jgi:hypothetical protein
MIRSQNEEYQACVRVDEEAATRKARDLSFEEPSIEEMRRIRIMRFQVRQTNLTPAEEKVQWDASEFEVGKIPERPPPKEVCG